jgi:hypothetical protein
MEASAECDATEYANVMPDVGTYPGIAMTHQPYSAQQQQTLPINGDMLWRHNLAEASCPPQVLSLERMLRLDHDSVGASADKFCNAAIAHDDYDVGAYDDPPPQLGSERLPSVGSVGHFLGRCKPCAFATRVGCANGSQCEFCHLCTKDEKKRRRKDKKALMSVARKLLGDDSQNLGGEAL